MTSSFLLVYSVVTFAFAWVVWIGRFRISNLKQEWNRLQGRIAMIMDMVLIVVNFWWNFVIKFCRKISSCWLPLPSCNYFVLDWQYTRHDYMYVTDRDMKDSQRSNIYVAVCHGTDLIQRWRNERTAWEIK